jgi:hypothetical protein
MRIHCDGKSGTSKKGSGYARANKKQKTSCHDSRWIAGIGIWSIRPKGLSADRHVHCDRLTVARCGGNCRQRCRQQHHPRFILFGNWTSPGGRSSRPSSGRYSHPDFDAVAGRQATANAARHQRHETERQRYASPVRPQGVVRGHRQSAPCLDIGGGGSLSKTASSFYIDRLR